MPQGRPWERYAGQRPPTQPPPIPRVIQGPAREPPPQTPTQAATDDVTLRLRELEVAEQERKAQQEAQAAQTREDMRRLREEQARVVIGTIDRALGTNGQEGTVDSYTTGLSGAVVGRIPGTEGYNLRSQLTTVKANLGFDRLQQMREMSPTGGALGQVAIQELEALQASLGNLDNAQSEDELRTNLTQIRRHYMNWLDAVEGRGFNEQLESLTELVNGIAAPRMPGEYEEPPEIVVGVGINPGTGEPYSQEEIDAALNPETARVRRGIDRSMGPAGPGDLIRHGATLGLSDEVTGVTEAFRNAVTAPFMESRDFDLAGSYQAGRDATRDWLDEGRDRLGWAGTAAEVAGGLISANPTRVVAPATSRLRTIAEGGRGGAYGGALAGYGYGEGLEGSATNALLGAGVGGALGAGFSALASRGGGLPTQAQLEAPEIMAAAQRQGVPINAGNVRPGARNALAYLESSPGSAGPVQRNMAEQAQAIEEGAERLAGSGAALDTNAAGEMVRGAGSRWLETTRNRATRLYDRAGNIAGQARITADNAIRTIQARLAQLRQVPETNRARIDALEGILADILQPDGTPIPLGVQAVRDLRTGVRVQNKDLTATPAEADIHAAVNAISDDIAAGLRQQSPDASRLYERADSLWRQQAQFRSDIYTRLVGRADDRSSEAVFARLQAMASPRGDGRRMAEVLRVMSPEERADLAATVADSLGRRAAGEEFSPALFASQARRLSDPARILIFGREGAEAVDDLARLARNFVAVQGRMNNSRSGQVSNYRAFFGSMFGTGSLGSAAGAIAGGPAGGVAGGAAGMALGAAANAAAVTARNLSARLLTYRPFVRWLGRAPRSNDPRAIQAHIRELGGLGRNAPVAVEMQNLQQMLLRQFSPAVAESGQNQQ